MFVVDYKHCREQLVNVDYAELEAQLLSTLTGEVRTGTWQESLRRTLNMRGYLACGFKLINGRWYVWRVEYVMQDEVLCTKELVQDALKKTATWWRAEQ